MARDNKAYLYLLAVVLGISGLRCSAMLDPGAASPEYIRLLDVDPPQAIHAMRLTNEGHLLFLSTIIVPRPQKNGAGRDTGFISNFELTTCDGNGNVLSSKRYGDTSDIIAADCIVLADGGVAVAATHVTQNSAIQLKSAIVFFRLDATGNVMLTRQFAPSTDVNQASTIRQTAGGGFLIAASRHNGLNGTTDAIFLYLSANGDSVGIDVVSSTTNGDVYHVSDMSTVESGDWVAFGSYIASGGNPQPWSFRHMGGQLLNGGLLHPHGGSARCITRTGPGGSKGAGQSYIGAGDSSRFGPGNLPTSASIISLDFTGDINGRTVWNRDFTLDAHSSFTSIIPVAGGGLAATGFNATSAGDTSIILFRFDDKGNEVWPHKEYPFAGGEFPTSIVETPDHGFAIGGITTSFGGRPGGRQIFLLRLRTDGSYIQ
jgi:hypothetical protein